MLAIAWGASVSLGQDLRQLAPRRPARQMPPGPSHRKEGSRRLVLWSRGWDGHAAGMVTGPPSTSRRLSPQAAAAAEARRGRPPPPGPPLHRASAARMSASRCQPSGSEGRK